MTVEYRQQRQPLRVVQLQGILVLALGFLASFKGMGFAGAVVGGALVAFVSSAVAYGWMFRPFGAQQTKAIVHAFYGAQVLKFLLTVGGFVLLFGGFKAAGLPVLLGFIVVQSVFWIAPWLGEKKKR